MQRWYREPSNPRSLEKRERVGSRPRRPQRWVDVRAAEAVDSRRASSSAQSVRCAQSLPFDPSFICPTVSSFSTSPALTKATLTDSAYPALSSAASHASPRTVSQARERTDRNSLSGASGEGGQAHACASMQIRSITRRCMALRQSRAILFRKAVSTPL